MGGGGRQDAAPLNSWGRAPPPSELWYCRLGRAGRHTAPVLTCLAALGSQACWGEGGERGKAASAYVDPSLLQSRSIPRRVSQAHSGQ